MNSQKMQIPSCPVLRPTQQQFNDFYRYVHQLDKNYKNTYGMVKVIPPAGWTPQSTNYQHKLGHLIVKNPIEQNVQGSGGYFQSKNLVQNKMSMRDYRKYAERESKIVEGKSQNEKEKLFWKTITYSSPLYGADLTGTLMDQNAHAWNFNNLNSLLKYALTEKVKGVTQPYCYIGSWKAFFSWHKEDLDLAAINYIHEGASKIWYSIAKQDSHILQQQAKLHYREQSRKCSQFLRHKTFLIKPDLLQRNHQQLKISRVEHRAGEIMIVFGGAYHCGFNCGFNIAQAVNYATIDWLKQLTSVRFCKCFRKSVRGEIESILYNLQNSSIYDELCKSQQFMALQNFVLDLQLQQDQYCEQEKEQMENININQTVFVADKKEIVETKAKEKDSKKIKKDRLKKNKEQQEYKPSYKCTIINQRAAKNIKKSDLQLQSNKKMTAEQQLFKTTQNEQHLLQ